MTALVEVGVPARRRGPRHWLAGYGAMLRWEVTRLRLLLPITILVQVFTGAGLVLGIGLFFEAMAPETALYLSTGAVVISLVTVGLVLGPQLVAQLRQEGSYEYLASLPVPRSSAVAAWLSLNAFIGLPGMAGAVAAAMWRYGAEFHLSWSIVPAAVLVLACGVMIGHVYAHAVGDPQVIAVISQLLIFIVFGFSPIAFPPENLPGWLAAAHRFFPFVHMGNVVRDGLTDGLASDVELSYLVLGSWTVVGMVLAAVLSRRRR
jgi:ABC-2 type transport system permease protein